MKDLISYRDGNVCGISFGCYIALKNLKNNINSNSKYQINIFKNKKILANLIIGISIQLLSLTRIYKTYFKKSIIPFIVGLLSGITPGYYLGYNSILLLCYTISKTEDITTFVQEILNFYCNFLF